MALPCSLVREGARAKDYETAIMWLSDCGLVHKVSRVNAEKQKALLRDSISVAVQNDSDRGPIAVSVEVEGVEVRIPETVEREEKNAYSEEIPLLADTFWDGVTKSVYYDFNEDIYEVSKIISFDDKVYKVNESIADEVTAIMK